MESELFQQGGLDFDNDVLELQSALPNRPQSKRPESKPRRPETVSPASNLLSYQSENEGVLSNFYKFLKFHFIKVGDLWKTSQVEISMDDFARLVKGLGYQLNAEEVARLGELLMVDRRVHLRKLTQIPMWDKCEAEVMEIMNRSILQLVSSSKSFFKQESAKPTLRKSVPADNSKARPLSSITRYVGSRPDKTKQQQSKLTQLIHRNESEEKFDVLVKMGEANTILRKMNRNARFEVSCKESNEFQIREVDEDGWQALTENDFTRRFKHIRRKEKQQRNQKYWEHAMPNAQKTNFKGTLLMMLEEKDELTKDTLNERIKQRDKQLKVILLETLRLKLVLKEQYDILQKKGINQCR